jgi:hypothetical protein
MRNPIAKAVRSIRQQVIPDKREKEKSRIIEERLEDCEADWPFQDAPWLGFGDD